MRIGEIIDAFLKKKGISQQSCAEKMGVNRQYINQQLKKRKDLETDVIMRFSIALEHDFFAELSRQLPPEIRARQKSIASPLEDAVVDMLREKFPNVFK